MLKTKRFWALTVLTALMLSAVLMGGWTFTSDVSAQSGADYEGLKVFTEVLSVVKRNYVEEVDAKDLIYDALEGMLKALDPHSSFLPPEAFKEMQVETKGEFGGLGIQIGIKEGVLTVIAPIEDTPAWRAGLKAGDSIVKIEDESTADMSLHDAVSRMRGPKGTEISITVDRDEFEKPKVFTIVRDIIKIQSVKARMVEKDIGYIKLTQFQERSADDMEVALKELSDEGMKALILDLRNNPGGLLRSAVDVSSLFLPRGDMVVYIKGRSGEKAEYKAGGSTFSTELPLAVLVNQGSASASEIVAGAMKDWNRGVVLGVKTFGKGSVQSVIPLSDGSGVRLTTSRYYTPKGTSIQNTGIVPDIEVELKAPEGAVEHPVVREKDLDGHLENDQRGGETGSDVGQDMETAVFMADMDDADDTQLQRALDLMKTWLILKQKPEVDEVPADS